MDAVGKSRAGRVQPWIASLGAALVALAFVPWVMAAVTSSVTASADNQYVGSEKCKSCHESAASGDQYGKWLKAKHSKALARLSSPEAVAAGTPLGITEPAKSEKCLSCHVTGYGEAADHFAKSYDQKAGVGCESCHGPGQKHVKARLASTDDGGGDAFGFEEPAEKGRQTIPDGEIIKDPGEKRCLDCHNSNSPTFKAFDYKERHQKIAHPDPRKG